MAEGGTVRFRVGGCARILFATAAGVALIAIVARGIDPAAVRAVLGDASAAPLIVALLALCLDFFLRAVRFRAILSAAERRRLPLRPMIAPFVASFGVSDLLPLRLGDGLRIVWFCRDLRLAAGTVVGAMLVERAFDLASLVIVSLVALALIGPLPGVGDWLTPLLSAMLVAAVLLLLAPGGCHRIARWVAARTGWPVVDRIASLLATAADAVRRVGAPSRLAGLLGASVLLWLLESVVLYGAWISVSGPGGAGAAPLLSFALGTLGTLVPSLPGHFGAFEFGAINALTLTGSGRDMATAIVLLAHLILWAPTALFAVGWLVFVSARPGRHARAAAAASG